jgi:hypothetical protein
MIEALAVHAQRFRAIGDPTRLKMLELLTNTPRRVCEVQPEKHLPFEVNNTASPTASPPDASGLSNPPIYTPRVSTLQGFSRPTRRSSITKTPCETRYYLERQRTARTRFSQTRAYDE